MDVSRLPLNALRAFEASARLGSFTRAGMELRVTQTAISHQVKALERLLGITLFQRLSRGLVLTDEGQALLPVLTDGFGRMSATLSQFEDGNFHEILTVGVVSTFAIGWLLERLPDFRRRHPRIDLRVKTNNNRADVLADGLDLFIRFGDGAWHGTDAVPLLEAPLSPVASPAVAARLGTPGDLLREDLLRSYRVDEWSRWFRAAGLGAPPPRGGWMFDSSLALAAAAERGVGVALVPVAMFGRAIGQGAIVQPFAESVTIGRYWLTSLKARRQTTAMAAFRDWILAETAAAERCATSTASPTGPASPRPSD